MLVKLRKIYRSSEIACTYKRSNPEYKPGKVILVRNEGIAKCVRCKWNTFAGLECGMYRIILHNQVQDIIKRVVTVQTLCLMGPNKAYTIESIRIC